MLLYVAVRRKQKAIILLPVIVIAKAKL